MLDVAKFLSNKDYFLRLNTIPLAEDAIANDVQCDLKKVLGCRSEGSSE